ncbi:toll-like receptor 2 [Chaetodon trifascialis]|uniref:toll-like receptor 2 n=1 Tax=Chaetodon trifascialis TaxID=109706 RepID=UPI0039910CE1
MPTLTFLMFVLLLKHHSFSLSRPQCHSCQQMSCNCSRQKLKEVPAAPSKLITELDLSFNRLRTIEKNDFAAFVSLRSLIMNNNLIKTIHERAFAPLANLETLDLSFNRLEMLSAEWFENLFSLQHLNLLGNQYKELGQGNLFLPLRSLKTLHFGGLHLQSVRKSDFSGLRALDKVVFDGRNLQAYAEGSLRDIGLIKHVALDLNGPFRSDQSLVEAILSDVAHPNTTLTFTDTVFSTAAQMSPIKRIYDGGTTRVILKNVNITVGACIAILNKLSQSNLTMFALEDVKFSLGYVSDMLDDPIMEHLEEVFFRNVYVPRYYSFPALYFLKPVLKGVQKVSVINCKLFAIPCETDLSNMEYIDISDNIMTDLTLSQMMCDGKGHHWNLQTINVSRNHLQSINSHLFTKRHKLKNIDMSKNAFHSMPDTCYWPPSLQFLNLSSTRLEKVTSCLPRSLRILDLSHNTLTVFNIELPFLIELRISGNKLSSLPEGSLYPHLMFLSIQNNNLHTISSKNLNDYNNLTSLEAGANTYVCSCEFVAFMTSDMSRVTIGDKFNSYICDSPDAMRGQRAAEARLSVFECHTALSFSLLCLGILAVCLLIAGLCHRFSVVWYVRMTWAWLRAKRKPKLKKGELEYDAFVSYSEMDSGWVEAHLVPELEQADPPLQLCLHKRDFIPGGWILDNIMDAIEKSHRTLFVLSQHFVRSEWCKYELDYTHFRLFDQNDDAVVLILLEPIDTETIPKKFCKLRKVMNSRTYLEWPDDDNQIPRFWQCLRTAIRRPETDGGNHEKETVGI